MAKYCQTSNRNISTPRPPSEECLYILEMPDYCQFTQFEFSWLPFRCESRLKFDVFGKKKVSESSGCWPSLNFYKAGRASSNLETFLSRCQGSQLFKMIFWAFLGALRVEIWCFVGWKSYKLWKNICQTLNQNISSLRAPTEECLYFLEMGSHWQSAQLGFKVLLAPITM